MNNKIKEQIEEIRKKDTDTLIREMCTVFHLAKYQQEQMLIDISRKTFSDFELYVDEVKNRTSRQPTKLLTTYADEVLRAVDIQLGSIEAKTARFGRIEMNGTLNFNELSETYQDILYAVADLREYVNKTKQTLRKEDK